MKKIVCLFLSACFVCVNLLVLAETNRINTEEMMTNIEELSSFPRGYKNDGISNARQLIEKIFYKYNLQVDMQSFETNLLKSEQEKYTGVNIIGIKKPNTNNNKRDVLLITAHYDGVNDVPAANDNASGVAVMLELVRLLADVPTDTEIRFIAFDCEEVGLLGSEYYSNSITNEANNIIGVLNFDMLGAKLSDGVHIYSGDDYDNYLFDILKSEQSFSDINIDRNDVNDTFSTNATSDYASFRAKLIPTLSFSNVPIEDEIHNSNDTIDNINPDMLEYAVKAGEIIAKEIMSVDSPSYVDKLSNNLRDIIYTIPLNKKIPFGKDRKEFADALGIELKPVISDTTKLKYQAKVKLFDVQKTFKMIIEENAYTANVVLPAVTSCIIDVGDISFNEIYNIISDKLGLPNILENEYVKTYTWSDLLYCNQYSLSTEGDSFKLMIYPYIEEQQSYVILNSDLVRLQESFIPREKLLVSKNENEYISMITYPEVSEDLPTTKEAIAVWNKIKSKLSPHQISQIGYITLGTNGVGGDNSVRIITAEPTQDAVENIILEMKNKNLTHSENETYLDKIRLYVDYVDLLSEQGNCYNDDKLNKEIAIAYVKSSDKEYSSSLWAIEQIVLAITEDILPIELAENYTMDISRLDFCKIAYRIFSANNINLNNTFFIDTNSKEVSFLAAIGIIKGKSENIFAPNENITREEIASILARIIKYYQMLSETDERNTYNDDYCISDWARNDVYLMQQLNVMEGMSDGNFSPKSNCTKEQAITVIMRVYDMLNNINCNEERKILK